MSSFCCERAQWRVFPQWLANRWWRAAATVEGGKAQAIHTSIQSHLSAKCFFCDTNRGDWKWVTSVEYNLERFWIRTVWKRRNKDRKLFECIWLPLCPFCTERVISIPCLPPVSPAKESVNMITHWFLALTHRIEKHDWQEEISSRTLFAGAVDLFVCNGVAPRLSVICQLRESSGFS